MAGKNIRVPHRLERLAERNLAMGPGATGMKPSCATVSQLCLDLILRVVVMD